MKEYSCQSMNETITLVLGFTLPCLMTTLGAALVFFFKKSSKLINMITIGLAAGIMLSASIWSLLLPALENAEESWGDLSFIPVVLGFLIGGIFMIVLDFVSSKFSSKDKTLEDTNNFSKENAEKLLKNQENNEKVDKKRAFKLFSAITIHNIPEGLSVGFTLGTAVATQSSFLVALMFALGIALQNFPEGLATSLPLYNCLGNKKKAFWLGTLSGIVEPIFAIAGFFLAASISSLLPWLLAFSAGAMIYVIIEELLTEIHFGEKASVGTWAFMIGFVIMMILDICL